MRMRSDGSIASGELIRIGTFRYFGSYVPGNELGKSAMIERSHISRLLLCSALVFSSPTLAQAPNQTVAVGVVSAAYQPMAETTEINGRIQARERVDLIARVTAFMTEKTFNEGAEVKKGDLLYRLERGPFVADVEAKEAAVKQAQAQLTNADLSLSRAQQLLKTNAGTQATVDAMTAAQLTQQGALQAAQAQLDLARINLEYTEIKSPIDGRIGRTAITPGNVVGPTSGTLATVVSADPMYVVFPVAMRRIIELRNRYAERGGFGAVALKLRLPNGKMYKHDGKLDFIDIAVSKETDSLTLRGTIPNPVLLNTADNAEIRELSDGQFVSVILEAVEPTKVLAVPRGAVLSDQQGSYVFVVSKENKADQRRVEIGQTTPQIAGVKSGLKEGEKVIVQGIQRVRPNIQVTPTELPLDSSRS